MNTIKVTLKDYNGAGIGEYTRYAVAAALLDRENGLLHILEENGDETVQSLTDVSTIETEGTILEYA